MRNTPSRGANTVLVNKTRNKPKSTNEDSIAKNTLYRRKPGKRKRGKKGRRAKFSPSLLSTISSAGQQLALGQLNIRWELTSWSYSVFQWSSDQLISVSFSVCVLDTAVVFASGNSEHEVSAGDQRWSRQTCSPLIQFTGLWLLGYRAKWAQHSRRMILRYFPQGRQKGLGGWLHGPRYSKS